ncbi:MAG: class A beta-lactamase-related serine hydrolase [Chitinophagaceae bacterium]|nr:MAG: class A beta-lactamase-related serine hydrolase [Chitinophagaceae bacterium]
MFCSGKSFSNAIARRTAWRRAEGRIGLYDARGDALNASSRIGHQQNCKLMRPICLFVFLLFTSRCGSQDFTAIDSTLRALAQEEKFSASVLVASGGTVLYEKAAGWANREDRVPFTAGTASNIASVGKMLTAVLVLQLVEEGRIRPDDTVEKLLPGARVPNGHLISVHHLLTHTSGLGNYMTDPGYAALQREGEPGMAQLLPLVASLPLAFNEPGSACVYSNAGYIVLGGIIESVTGKPYADVLRTRILEPLGMRHTFLQVDRNSMQGLATGYTRGNPAGPWKSTRDIFPTPAPDGGLFTTARDLFLFDQALYHGKLLQPTTRALMMKPHVRMEVPGSGAIHYGYGMMNVDLGGGNYTTGHNGGTLGYNTEYRHLFAGGREYTLILISNYERTIRPLFSQIQTLLRQAR